LLCLYPVGDGVRQKARPVSGAAMIGARETWNRGGVEQKVVR
jgi:hypothetical protein